MAEEGEAALVQLVPKVPQGLLAQQEVVLLDYLEPRERQVKMVLPEPQVPKVIRVQLGLQEVLEMLGLREQQGLE
jgi:hypothetical protein